MYDIIISGYYGFDNSGDDALLMAIIDDLREKNKDISILVLSKKPEETQRNYDVDSINRFNIFKIIRTIRKCKLLINGGGSLIQDVTSSKSLYYYLGVIIIAKFFKRKVMVYANGIGPINRERNKKFVSRILNKTDYITLREKKSVNELINLGIDKPPIEVTADPALNIKSAANSRIKEIFSKEGIPSSDKIVGFSLREWGQTQQYINILAEAIDFMSNKYNVLPLFIPMHYPHDLKICEDISNKMKNKAYIIKKQYSISETVGIIGQCELLVGMRLHSLIYAVTAIVPVIGLAYDPKVTGFLEYTGQNRGLNIETLKVEEVKKVLETSWENKRELQENLMKYNNSLKAKAKMNAKIAISLIEGDCDE